MSGRNLEQTMPRGQRRPILKRRNGSWLGGCWCRKWSFESARQQVPKLKYRTILQLNVQLKSSLSSSTWTRLVALHFRQLPHFLAAASWLLNTGSHWTLLARVRCGEIHLEVVSYGALVLATPTPTPTQLHITWTSNIIGGGGWIGRLCKAAFYKSSGISNQLKRIVL
eukprot:scaffold2578_cov197-Alexandrium_tamarense.AAC.3